MLNLHRLLYKQDDPVSFHAHLIPTESQRLELTAAKNAIRDYLRVTIADASITDLKLPNRIEPRFRSQGSWSYRTCIQPAHQPPQEMDWDFGVYLPATVWLGSGPNFAAKAYFDLVENSLKALCKAKGWELMTGAQAKDSCIRIRINYWAHIDIPLYAAPESQFHEINEIVKADIAHRRSLLAMDDASYLAESEAAGEPTDFPWQDLENIVMAKRTGEWQKSDPFSVTRWFIEAIEEHGDQLRRLCRYLKAWRDFQWREGGGPSSIVLMICAVETFERYKGRDDVVLVNAAERMISMLRGDIRIPAIDAKNEEDFNRMKPVDRVEASRRAAELHSTLKLARSYGVHLKEGAIQKLQQVFGSRVPYDTNFIEVETESDRVRATAAASVVAPLVPSTRSG